MMEPYKKLISIISNNEELMVQQLHYFCEINSGTTNLHGLAQIATALSDAYKPIADAIEVKNSLLYP